MVLLTLSIPVSLKLKCGCLARRASKKFKVLVKIEEDAINDWDNGKWIFPLDLAMRRQFWLPMYSLNMTHSVIQVVKFMLIVLQ